MTQQQGNQALKATPPHWGAPEATACTALIRLALAEDLGQVGDVTSNALLPEDLTGLAVVVARAEGIVAGLPAFLAVCNLVDPTLNVTLLVADGFQVRKGTELASLRGSMRTMLSAERTALNFLQRLSGVATQTRRYVDTLAGATCKLLDTRKTTPGWRTLEKYAVRCGGGHNHRIGLYDLILIKDNHLAALGRLPDPIGEAVKRARASAAGLKVEIEVDSLPQLERALAAAPDIILLDNMSVEKLREAVGLRNRLAPQIQLEASGGVTVATLPAMAATGVDFISVGALTHSAVALDLALDYQKE